MVISGEERKKEKEEIIEIIKTNNNFPKLILTSNHRSRKQTANRINAKKLCLVIASEIKKKSWI